MITTLTITRKGIRYWTTQSNEDVSSRDSDSYSGTRTGNYITIKTFTGGIIYRDAPYTAFRYIDNVEPANTVNSFSSAEQLQSYLVEQNFYPPIDVNSGGGSGGVDRFKELLDVAVPNFIGREGFYIRIDQNGTFLEAVPSPNSALKIQDLINVANFMPRGKLLMSSSQIEIGSTQAAGVVFVDPVNYINRPAMFAETQILIKGWIRDGSGNVIINEEQYALEVGDEVLRHFVYPMDEDNPIPRVETVAYAQYLGGDENIRDNYRGGISWFNDLIED